MARITPVHSGYTILNGAGTGTNGSRIDVWAEYCVTAQNATENTSCVKAYFYAALREGQSSSTKYGNGLSSDFSVDGSGGSKVENGAYDFTSSANLHLLGSFEGEVAHNDDGSKSITIAGSFSTRSTYISGGSVSGTVALPAIARLSRLSCPESAELGSTLALGITARDAAYRHLLRLTLGSKQLEQNAEPGQSSLSLEVPLAFAEAIPNAAQAQAAVQLFTYSGQTLLGSTEAALMLTVPESVVPAAGELSLTRIDGEVPAGWGICVQGKSKVQLALEGAAGALGSTVTGYWLEGGGSSVRSAQMETPLLSESGTLTFSGYVRDSRGRTSPLLSETVYVHPWETPRLTEVEMFRCDAGGAADENGTCLNVRFAQQYSACGGHNSAQVVLKYRVLGTEVWSTSAALTAGQDNLLSGFAISSTYELLLEIRDAFTAGSYAGLLQTAERIVNIRADGQGMALGKMSEKQGLEVEWPVYLQQMPQVGGRSLLDYVYPVGSIYMSMQAADPSLLFGGSWQAITDAFLLPASASGKTGGEATHTLTLAEIPSHNHMIWDNGGSGSNSYHVWATTWKTTANSGALKGSSISWSGGGAAHNNMPPYLTVYCWQRIA